MKNTGLFIALGLGLLLLTKKKSSSEQDENNNTGGTQTPPINPNLGQEARSISANEVFQTGVPENGSVVMNSQEIDILKNACQQISQVAPWFINYLSDKSNLLPTTNQQEVDMTIDVFEEMQECVDILCSAVDSLSPNKPISNTLAVAINDSAQCFEDIQNTYNLDTMNQIAYPPQNLPNFIS